MDGRTLSAGKGVKAMTPKVKVVLPPIPPGHKLIFRAWKTDKNGNRLYARDYGKRGWPLVVPINR